MMRVIIIWLERVNGMVASPHEYVHCILNGAQVMSRDGALCCDTKMDYMQWSCTIIHVGWLIDGCIIADTLIILLSTRHLNAHGFIAQKYLNIPLALFSVFLSFAMFFRPMNWLHFVPCYARGPTR